MKLCFKKEFLIDHQGFLSDLYVQYQDYVRLKIRLAQMRSASGLVFDSFVSLVRSSDLLERILDRLGLLERQVCSGKDDIEESDIVEITLGNATQVFNSHNRFDCYCFAIRGKEHSQVNICLKINQNPLDYHLAKFSKTIPNTLIDFQIFKYKCSSSKDPPLIIR